MQKSYFFKTPEKQEVKRKGERNYKYPNKHLPKFGLPGRRKSGGADDDDESPYKLELSVQVRNLFNRTNGGTPVGNLSSLLFGESASLASGFGFGGGRQSGGNRRVRFEVQFSF